MAQQQTPMRQKLRVIFRVLSVITSLESACGLFFTVMAMLVYPFVSTTLENKLVYPYLHPRLVMYLMSFANILFDGLLLIAGVLLWKFRRRGLFLLAYTLVAEVVYFIAILLVEVGGEMIKAHLALLSGDRGPLQGTLGAMMGVGNMSLGIQFITAFPIVAGVLIFFAYRYLGISARPLQ
jgi:hypothetical protein